MADENIFDKYTEIDDLADLYREIKHDNVIFGLEYGSTPFSGHVKSYPDEKGRQLHAEFLEWLERVKAYIAECQVDHIHLQDEFKEDVAPKDPTEVNE